MRRLLIPGLLCALAACAHVPFGTMWAMRNFERADLVAMEASELRAAIRVPEAFAVEREGHLLRATLQQDGQPEQLLEAQLVVEFSTAGSETFERKADHRWHAFKLTPEGERGFRAIQKALGAVSEGSKGSFALEVKPNMAIEMKDRKPGRVGEFSVMVRLGADRGWLTLVEDYPIDITKEALEQGSATKAVR
jgi:hypothetical protein